MIDRSSPAHVLRGEIATLEAEIAAAVARCTEQQQSTLATLRERLERLKARAGQSS